MRRMTRHQSSLAYLCVAGVGVVAVITLSSAGRPAAGGPQAARPAAAAPGATAHLASRPETTVWGEFPIDRPPALTVKSGDTVTIDTLTHAGTTQQDEPAEYFRGLGVRREEILQDVIDFWKTRPSRPREGRSGHVLTGPVYVDGAEPGDMLEIQIVDVSLRVQYGVNSTGAASGVLGTRYPGTRPGDTPPPVGSRLIRTGTANGRPVAFVTPDVAVPLRPFMGIIAVAPPYPRIGQPGISVDGVQSSTPPGVFGGNLDYKDLTSGSTLFLPVFHTGARVYVGDPHSVQGDGEVNGTAVEQSLTGRFRFVVHKSRKLSMPRAELPEHWVVMGIDVDLNRAMRIAVQEAVDFLVAEKKLSPSEAYTLASIACDFHVAEAVDLTQVVVGRIPKAVFRAK
jgi:acetamidase/formamidase